MNWNFIGWISGKSKRVNNFNMNNEQIKKLKKDLQELSNEEEKYIEDIKTYIIGNFFFVLRILNDVYNKNKDLIKHMNMEQNFEHLINIINNIISATKDPKKYKLLGNENLDEIEHYILLFRKNGLLNNRDYNNIMKQINNIVSFYQNEMKKNNKNIFSRIRNIESYIESVYKYYMNNEEFKDLRNKFELIKRNIMIYANLYTHIVGNHRLN